MSSIDAFNDSDSEAVFESADEIQSPSITDKAKGLTRRTKEKTRRLLHFGPPEVESTTDSDSALEDDIFQDAAFNPAKVLRKETNEPQAGQEASTKANIKSFINATIHPKRQIRSDTTRRVAGKISSVHGNIISNDDDRELLDAHHALAQAESHVSFASSEYDEAENSDLEVARERLLQVQDRRESLQAAWILSRHVTRVRVVHSEIPKPQYNDFRLPENENQPPRIAWERYLAKLVLYYSQGFTARYIDDFDEPPFDIHDLAHILERLAITSTPWQAFFMDVRQVYMWTDPRRTIRWAIIFWILWYTQHIVGYLYGYIIYATIRNKFRPDSVESIRNSIERGLVREAQVHAWVELIQAHGKHEWVEPLLDNVGPIIQMQLGDLANFAECLINFYRHERPGKTAATLFFFLCCFAITMLTDMEFCMKVVWFILGSAFFFSFPLATRFPRYRIVVNLLRWIFWDIPSHAELAIIRLQEKVILRDAKKTKQDANQNVHDVEENDFRSDKEPPERLLLGAKSPGHERHMFKVYCPHQLRGRLIVSRAGIELRTKEMHQTFQYSELLELQKIEVTSKVQKAITTSSEPAALRFLWSAKSHSQPDLEIITRVSDRDRIFNLILGWSNQRWQALQPRRSQRENNEERGHIDRAVKRVMM